MRRIVFGVAIVGVATSIAIAVRSQLQDGATVMVAAPAPASTAAPVPAPPVASPLHTTAPAVTPVVQDTPPKPKRYPHPPVVEHAENFQVPDAATILTRASNAYGKVQSLRADFVQQRQNPLLGSNTTSRGTLYQRRPDRFLMKFTQPAGDVIVADGKYFWVYYPSADKRQVIRAPASQSASGGVDLQAQFLGDPVRRFNSTFNGIEKIGGRSAYVLTLVPKTNLGYKSLKVWIDNKDYLARRFIITESNGTAQDITLSNLALNPTLSNDLFRFTPPAGAHIVER